MRLDLPPVPHQDRAARPGPGRRALPAAAGEPRVRGQHQLLELQLAAHPLDQLPADRTRHLRTRTPAPRRAMRARRRPARGAAALRAPGAARRHAGAVLGGLPRGLSAVGLVRVVRRGLWVRRRGPGLQPDEVAAHRGVGLGDWAAVPRQPGGDQAVPRPALLHLGSLRLVTLPAPGRCHSHEVFYT